MKSRPGNPHLIHRSRPHRGCHAASDRLHEPCVSHSSAHDAATLGCACALAVWCLCVLATCVPLRGAKANGLAKCGVLPYLVFRLHSILGFGHNHRNRPAAVSSHERALLLSVPLQWGPRRYTHSNGRGLLFFLRGCTVMRGTSTRPWRARACVFATKTTSGRQVAPPG